MTTRSAAAWVAVVAPLLTALAGLCGKVAVRIDVQMNPPGERVTPEALRRVLPYQWPENRPPEWER